MRALFLLPFLYFALPLSSQVVLFPGDTNNDGVANQYDILPVGVAYGIEGFPRPGATLDWIPQFHPMQWLQFLPVSNIDLAFVDGDGNGTIDSLDLDAIAFNFDSTQAESKPPPQPYLLSDTCFSCPKPNLHITFDRDTAMVEDTIYAFIDLEYPPNLPPPAGALGLAFELNYPPENIQDELTKVFPDTMPGDLMFVTATNTLARAWRNVPEGKIGFGAAGKGNNALFSPRFLGAVEIVIEDMIIRAPDVEVDFWIDIANILIINQFEQVVCPGEIIVDTLLLFDPLDHIQEKKWEPVVVIAPNPAGETFEIKSADSAILKVEVFDLKGQRVKSKEYAPAPTQNFKWNNLSAGMYCLKIKTQHGTVLRRVVKK